MLRQEEQLEVTFLTCGQTKAEASGLCEDDFTASLSKLGKQQAAQLAPFVKLNDYRLVLSSPSALALETFSVLCPGKKPLVLSLLGPLKWGCLGHHPKTDFYQSLLNSAAPEREYKAKGAENLEQLRRRIKDFFTRLACALMWNKQDAVLEGGRPGNKVLVITHEIWTAELVTYIRERAARIAQIVEVKHTELTEKSELSEDELAKKKLKQFETSSEMLQTYTRIGGFPFEKTSPLKKMKILEAVRLESDRSQALSISKSKSAEKRIKLTVTEREVPSEYLVTGKCSMTVVKITCKELHACRGKLRNELNDDFLLYEIIKERSNKYEPDVPQGKTKKRL